MKDSQFFIFFSYSTFFFLIPILQEFRLFL